VFFALPIDAVEQSEKRVLAYVYSSTTVYLLEEGTDRRVGGSRVRIISEPSSRQFIKLSLYQR